jgi:hypothetical protein
VDDQIYAVLLWLENSPVGEGLRASGVWTYAWLNLAHILGISTLFGAVLILDLRLLGAWRAIPAAAIATPTVLLAACGFGLAIFSGALMITVNATGYIGNPFLYVKLPLIALAFINVLVTTRLTGWRRLRAGEDCSGGDLTVLRTTAAVSLLLWLAVIFCGRMIGYW